MDTESRKKIIILYGNCHMENLTIALQTLLSDNGIYEIYPIPGICNIRDPAYFKQSIFGRCDVFIHQSIQLNNRYGEQYASENLIKRLKKDCQVIAVPNLYHLPLCFFPQYTEKQELKYRSGHTAFFRDEIIDNGFRSGKSRKEIKQDYLNADYYSKTEIKLLWDRFIDKVKAREKDWDIKISDLLSDLSKKDLLFYDPNHPTDIIIRYIAENILDILKITCQKHHMIDDIDIPRLDSYEMPLQRSVISYFGLDYEPEYRELRVTGNKILRMDMYLDDYIIQYESMLWQDRSISKALRVKSFVLYCILCLKEAIRRIKISGGCDIYENSGLTSDKIKQPACSR